MPTSSEQSRRRANGSDAIERIGISMPGSLLKRMDRMNRSRGFNNRSQAVCEMVYQMLSRHEAETGDHVMTGTLTLVYEHARNNLKRRLADIQYAHIDEVISSFHVLLEAHHTLEVVLLQGPADRLREIADEMISCKGVLSGDLKLVSRVIPPIHPRELSTR